MISIFLRVVLLVLILTTVWLYVRVVMPPFQQAETAQTTSAPAESQSTQALKPLPKEQMQLVVHTLAPELEASSE